MEFVIGMLSSCHLEMGIWGTATGLYPTFLVKPQVSWSGCGVALWTSSKFLEKIEDEIKNGKITCEDAMGYLAVYKIFFMVTLFFLFKSFITIGVRNSQDPLHVSHNENVWFSSLTLIAISSSLLQQSPLLSYS